MTSLSDHTLDRLRQATEAPDLSATRYRLVERIGRGGMGVVFLVEDQALGRRVALKVLDVAIAGDLADRLMREARILAQLEHPGIVPVHDVGTLLDGRVFYVMKYVNGSGLDEHVRALDSVPDRLRVFQKICDAVAFAHSRDILHRDLKPENVMVGPFGEVLVMDWGVANLLSHAAGKRSPVIPPGVADAGTSVRAQRSLSTLDGTVIGTPGYMSPEQARGETSRIDVRTDVFALGRILRFLLGFGSAEGRPAQPGGVPAPLAAVCAKAAQVDPAARYASVAELAADVALYLAGQPLRAYPDTFFRRVRRLLRRHQVALLLVLAYLVTRAMLILLARR